MRNLLKNYDLMTSEQEVFFWSLAIGIIFLGVVAYIGYTVYQARPCACSPGDDDTEKPDPQSKAVSIRYCMPSQGQIIRRSGRTGAA